VFSSNGYIITNNHVIENAETIEVIHQKKSYPAKIIGTDPSTDLALLKIEAINLPAIKIANSRKLAVGEWVLAVGNPFNLTSTVTAGIVSAKGRNINLISNASFPIESFIQTDAAINPGNSGGALVNTRGELVGINTAIFSRTGSYTGYGFAVPGDIVKKVVEDLIRYGTVQKAFFGADVAEVDDKVATKLNIDQIKGVAITDVLPGGPAANAGLRVDDVLLRINNQSVDGRGVYDEELAYYNPGDRVTIEYRRGKTLKMATVVLTNREGTTELLKRNLYASKAIGADLEALPKVERDKYSVENGVRIAKAYANGYIRRLGLEEGFVFLKINNQPMTEPADVEAALANAHGRTVIEGIDKNGSRGYYTFGY
jgi:S1-C subfamily serine protease